VPNWSGWEILLVAAIGYLLGSIPFGLVLTRLAGRGDIRSVGSGNIGATNVLRTGSRPLAAATLVGDMAKGTVAVMLGALFGEIGAVIAGFAAFLGHLFPIWLRFRGGKGVATYLGVLAGLGWWLAALFAGVWLVMAFATRFSSASALAASIIVAITLFAVGPASTGAFIAVMTSILWLRHRDNIRRLMAGTENRIGGNL